MWGTIGEGGLHLSHRHRHEVPLVWDGKRCGVERAGDRERLLDHEHFGFGVDRVHRVQGFEFRDSGFRSRVSG